MEVQSSSGGLEAPVQSHRFVGAPRHRVFAVFDDATAGKKAIDDLISEGLVSRSGLWVFRGESGLRELDPSGARHGIHGRVARLVQRAMSGDYEYIQLLAAELTKGSTVVAVPAKDRRRAARLAHQLAERGGHSFAYGAHWDFVRVAA